LEYYADSDQGLSDAHSISNDELISGAVCASGSLSESEISPEAGQEHGEGQRAELQCLHSEVANEHGICDLI
jgi:hypothetical protein